MKAKRVVTIVVVGKRVMLMMRQEYEVIGRGDLNVSCRGFFLLRRYSGVESTRGQNRRVTTTHRVVGSIG
jgi:hypothetical protein